MAPGSSPVLCYIPVSPDCGDADGVVFPGGRRVAAMTAFDIGYLRSLYWERPDVGAISKLLRIRKSTKKAQEEAGATQLP